jgi:integrase
MAPQYRKGKPSPWVVQYRASEISPTGKIVSRVKSKSFRTKGMAEEFEAKVADQKQARAAGLRVPSLNTLFIDHARDWLKRQKNRADYAFSSWKQDETRLRLYWVEKFGPLTLDSISSADILEHLDYLQYERNQSPASRNRHRALLNVLFKDALARGRVISNPVAAIPLIEEVKRKKRVHIKDKAQFEFYLAALKEEGLPYWAIGSIMAFTGARVCTANVVQYQDIDEQTGIVLLRRIEERAGGSKVVERLKGKAQIDEEQDIHVVPLLPRLREVIREIKKISPFTSPRDFIAANRNGSYIPYDTFKDVHKRAVEKARKRYFEVYKNTGDVVFPEFTSHAIRRFYATQAKLAGFSRAEIRELGGWSNEHIVGRYDLKDINHLIDKAQRLGFGEDNVLPLKKEAK